MPDINKIAKVYYQPTDPYHHEYDNLPLVNILTRQELLNAAVDINSDILRDSVGTSGTLSNRLNQSISDNGELKVESVDDTMHNIAYHTDGSILIESVEVSFVRMLFSERAKLSLITDEATDFRIKIESISVSDAYVELSTETILANSDTISWTVTSPNILTAETTFPLAAAHRHFFGVTPVAVDVSAPYLEFSVGPYSYNEEELIVYINGIRVFRDESVYVYDADGPDGTWALTSFVETDPDGGTFTFNRSIDPTNNVVRIDFTTTY